MCCIVILIGNVGGREGIVCLLRGIRCGVFILEFWCEKFMFGRGLCLVGIVYMVFLILIFD